MRAAFSIICRSKYMPKQKGYWLNVDQIGA